MLRGRRSRHSRAFFEACESGKGLAPCGAYCTPDAGSFDQTGALAEMKTRSVQADWVQGILTVLTNGHYDLHRFAHDAQRGTVAACVISMETHLAGSPMPWTGRTTCTSQASMRRLSAGKIVHRTKVWCVGQARTELRWA